jgi:hypothetical protein
MSATFSGIISKFEMSTCSNEKKSPKILIKQEQQNKEYRNKGNVIAIRGV